MKTFFFFKSRSRIRNSRTFLLTLSPTLKVSPEESVFSLTTDEKLVSRFKPGLGILEAIGKVPIPDEEDVEAAEVGLGNWLIFVVIIILTFLFVLKKGFAEKQAGKCRRQI